MTVTDGATNGVIAIVTVGVEPCVLGYDPANNKALLVNPFLGSIWPA